MNTDKFASRTENYQLTGESYEEWELRRRRLQNTAAPGVDNSSFSTVNAFAATELAIALIDTSSSSDTSSSQPDSFSGGGGDFGGGGSDSSW